jgi:membrane protein
MYCEASMSLRRIKFLPLFKETLLKWNQDNCIRLGASLSYYTIFSLFPLILVTLTIVQLLLDNSDAARDVILDALTSVTGGFRDEFVAALRAAREARAGTGILGPVLLILGASWVFGELVSAFNIIWGLEAPAEGGPMHFVRVTFFSFALILAGVFLLLVSMILSALLTTMGGVVETLPGGVLMWRVAHKAFNLIILTLVFALLLKYLPQTYIPWSDVWPGAILTALLWSLLQFAIAYYIAFSQFGAYGAIGSILALVVWVYLSSQVLFLGGEFTTVYARHYGSRALGPVDEPVHPASFDAHPVPAHKPRPLVAPHAIVTGATGVTLGVLGTIGVAALALVVSLGRAVRRLFV